MNLRSLEVGARDDALLCELAIDEVEHVLVVREGDELPEDTLALVLILLELEDVFVELLLQSLVGAVDADLLEVVHFEDFAAKNIQDADGDALTVHASHFSCC